MNYEHICIFINLAESLNFPQTALQMHISQSAVSQGIQSMENQLGFTLFNRTRKKVALTESGKSLYSSLKLLLNTYNKAIQQARQIADQRQEDLTIGYSGTPFENHMIPVYLRRFHKKYPSINIFLENYAHKELTNHLMNNDCDVIFTMPDIIAKMENIDYIDLYTGRYCAIFPPNISFDSTKNRLADLCPYRLIFLDSTWSPPTQKVLQSKIQKANSNLNLVYVNNISTCNAMVKAHLGVGIWADFVSSPADNMETKMPLDYPLHPHYGIATLKNGASTTSKQFSHWLKLNFEKIKNSNEVYKMN